MITRLLVLALMATGLALTACEPPTGPADPSPPSGTSTTTCGDLNVRIGSSPRLAFFNMADGAYGGNTFHIWAVDEINGKLFIKGTNTELKNSIPSRNAAQPSGALWYAARLGLDGYDPYAFDIDDPFIYGYLPQLPVATSPWTAKSGAYNHNTCPSKGTCLGKNEKDPSAPALVAGQKYVARVSMMVGKLATSHCWQTVFTY